MYSLFNQALARQHLAELVDEAAHERISGHLRKRARRLHLPPALLRRILPIEPDFIAIRRDLRFTLSEWCLESRTEHVEAVADIFTQRLRLRLGYGERRKQKRA